MLSKAVVGSGSDRADPPHFPDVRLAKTPDSPPSRVVFATPLWLLMNQASRGRPDASGEVKHSGVLSRRVLFLSRDV